MTIWELDREYLAKRSEVLNQWLDEIIGDEELRDRLEMIDFEFEARVGIEKIDITFVK